MQTSGPARSVMMGQSQGTYMGVSNVTSQSGSAYQQTVSMLHQSFKNPNWPPNFITPDNVLDYFCDPGNVFYDVSSCNQHIRMQNLNRPLHECLQSMQGIQYTVVGTFPPLYVIMKQRRNSPTNVTPLAYYYIVNGTVYQCPDIYTYVQSKLISIVDPLRQALEQARTFNRFNIAKGYYWEFKDSNGETVKKAAEEDEKPQLARNLSAVSRTIQFNFGGNEISSENDAMTTSGRVEKSVQSSSVNNQDLTSTEDPTSGISQQSVFTSPSSVPPTPAHRSTTESSSGPLSFPGTVPALGASSTDSQHETDAKRFKGN
uniref:Mediator of RNA polymerase II transcription subunit 6 n=1 Tax=Elaeophora elaphi TaxID=1147741 RepID=A0A0R3S084_9BILA